MIIGKPSTNDLPIRVLVVDDQAVVRSGLAAFLSIYDDLDLVGEANDGARADFTSDSVRTCK